MAYLVHPPAPPHHQRFLPIVWQSSNGPYPFPFPSTPLQSPGSHGNFTYGGATTVSQQPPPSPRAPSSPVPGSPVKAGIKRVRRKRCGACSGCSRSENCGKCVVCTNPNSTNSTCKQRRCEQLLHRPSTLVSPNQFLLTCFYVEINQSVKWMTKVGSCKP